MGIYLELVVVIDGGIDNVFAAELVVELFLVIELAGRQVATVAAERMKVELVVGIVE